MHPATSTRHLIQPVHQSLTATVSLTVSKATAIVPGDDPFRAEKRHYRRGSPVPGGDRLVLPTASRYYRWAR
jgi:hypothetical protein